MRINFCSSRHRVFPLFSKTRFFRKNAPPAESGRGINILKNYFQNEGVFWPFPDQQYPRNRSSQKLCHRLRLQFSLVFALRIRLPRCSPPFLSRILYIIRDIFATGRQWCFQFSQLQKRLYRAIGLHFIRARTGALLPCPEFPPGRWTSVHAC